MATTVAFKPLDQQVIVITGASSGIGLATALAAASRGAKIALNARSDQTLQDIVNHINAEGGTALHVPGDVANREDLEALAAAALQRFGTIDTWINNAGGSIYGRVEQTSLEDAKRLFDTNVWGVFNGCQIALKTLKQKGGALINVGSEVSDATIPLQVIYSASKHAVKAINDGLRLELEDENAPVSVTLIQPTATDTPFPEHAKNYMDKEPKLPSPMIDPDQVADAILYACTHQTEAYRVGATSKLNVTLSRIFPSLGEWMAKKQITRQQYDERPRNPDGALNQPGEAGRTHGVGGREMSSK